MKQHRGRAWVQWMPLGATAVIAAAFLASAWSVVWNPAAERLWTQANVDATIVDGEKVIAALNEYFAQHGEYPHGLAQLMPAFLDSIPPPKAGNVQWQYALKSNRKGFTLWFLANGRSAIPVGYYSSRVGTWIVDG